MVAGGGGRGGLLGDSRWFWVILGSGRLGMLGVEHWGSEVCEGFMRGWGLAVLGLRGFWCPGLFGIHISCACGSLRLLGPCLILPAFGFLGSLRLGRLGLGAPQPYTHVRVLPQDRSSDSGSALGFPMLSLRGIHSSSRLTSAVSDTQN